MITGFLPEFTPRAGFKILPLIAMSTGKNPLVGIGQTRFIVAVLKQSGALCVQQNDGGNTATIRSFHMGWEERKTLEYQIQIIGNSSGIQNKYGGLAAKERKERRDTEKGCATHPLCSLCSFVADSDSWRLSRYDYWRQNPDSCVQGTLTWVESLACLLLLGKANKGRLYFKTSSAIAW